MKNIKFLLVAMLMAIFSIFGFGVQVSANALNEEISYDINSDGEVNSIDVLVLKRAILTGSSQYTIIDLINMKKILLNNVAYAKIDLAEFEVSESSMSLLINLFFTSEQMVEKPEEQKIVFYKSSAIVEVDYSNQSDMDYETATVLAWVKSTEEYDASYVLYTDGDRFYIIEAVG